MKIRSPVYVCVCFLCSTERDSKFWPDYSTSFPFGATDPFCHKAVPLLAPVATLRFPSVQMFSSRSYHSGKENNSWISKSPALSPCVSHVVSCLRFGSLFRRSRDRVMRPAPAFTVRAAEGAAVLREQEFGCSFHHLFTIGCALRTCWKL